MSRDNHTFRCLIPRLMLVALLVLVWLAYWPGRSGGFVFDDYPNIVSNPSLQVVSGTLREWLGAVSSSPVRSLPRPLAMLSFALNIHFTHLDPVPLKLTNVAIHLLNVLLVFGLVRGVVRAATLRADQGQDGPDWCALAVAAAWGLHPLNLMAVLFVVQRMESLAQCFVLAGLWLYVAGRRRQLAGLGGWTRVLSGVGLFTVLGVMAKESAILLPLYALCLEVCIFRFQGAQPGRDRKLLAMYLLVLVIPAIAGLAWVIPQAFDPGAFASREFSLAERLMTEPRVICDYLRWTLLPDLGQLSLYHDDYRVSHSLFDPWTTSAAMAVLVLLAWLALRIRRTRPVSSVGMLWFLASHAITASIVPLELVFEHRNYFSSFGLCLMLGDIFVLAPQRMASRRTAAAALLALVSAFGGLTFLRAREWSSPVAFAVAEAAKHPQSPRASYYLGWLLANATGYRADSPLLGPAFQAFERARQVPNSNALPDQGALVLAARTGQPQDPSWWRHMQLRLRERAIGPQETGAIAGLVQCSIEGRCNFSPDDMLATFAAALSHGPNAEVLNLYGNYALNTLHDVPLALRLWLEAEQLDPAEPQYRIAQVKLLIALRRYDEAATGIEKIRRMGRPGQNSRVADDLAVRLGAARQRNPGEPTGDVP